MDTGKGRPKREPVRTGAVGRAYLEAVAARDARKTETTKTAIERMRGTK